MASLQAPLVPAVAAATASGTADVAFDTSRATSAVFMLNVTAVAAVATDLLDVFIQHSLDGSNYDDFVHFTQVTGAGGAKKFIAHWNSLVVPTSPLHVPASGTLAAGVLQGPVANNWRVKWVVGPTPTTVAAGSNAVNTSTFAGAGVLNVASTTGFATSGTITVATATTPATITYTGISGTTFTGCTTTAGGGVLATGGAVSNATQSFDFSLLAHFRRHA